jgi:uncharacterized MAPEG superfamily protein
MTLDTTLIVSAAIAWIMLLVGALARTRATTLRGLFSAFGNRTDLPAPSPFAGRAERAARNMLENIVLFTVVIVAASLAHVPSADLALPSTIFVAARLVYAPTYWLGITYVRTTVWAIGVGAIAWIALLALR